MSSKPPAKPAPVLSTRPVDPVAWLRVELARSQANLGRLRKGKADDAAVGVLGGVEASLATAWDAEIEREQAKEAAIMRSIEALLAEQKSEQIQRENAELVRRTERAEKDARSANLRGWISTAITAATAIGGLIGWWLSH